MDDATRAGKHQVNPFAKGLPQGSVACSGPTRLGDVTNARTLAARLLAGEAMQGRFRLVRFPGIHLVS